MIDLKKLLVKILQRLDGAVVREIKDSNQITWYSTSNPYAEHSYDVSKTGYTPIAVSFWTSGTGSSTIAVSTCCIDGNNIEFHARMMNNTPSSTTQNTVTFEVTYIKNDWL